MSKTAVIIGAGFGGLSLACQMAHQGWKVKVLEKTEQSGGRARLYSTDGYQFDMGPSWYLMPEVFEDFFKALGKNRSDYYQLDKLETFYKVFFEGQKSVTVTSDLEKTKALFETLEPNGNEKLTRYLKSAKYKYNIAMKEFLYREYKSIFSFFNWRMLTEGLKLDVFKTLDKFVSRFFTDHRAKKILEYAMVFLGNSPSNAPALYSIMSYVDLDLGVFFPKGGMNGVARAIEKLAIELGVEFFYNTEVTKLVVEKDRVSEICTYKNGSLGETYTADVIINAGDYHWGETQLLEPKYRSYSAEWWEKKIIAPSMFIVFLGINKKIPSLEHHNLYFSHDWDAHFSTIFEHPNWPENPCFYLSAISKTDPLMAPAGHENLFLLVPIAPGLEDTDSIREVYYEKVMDHVETILDFNLRESVVVKRIYSGRDFEKDYRSFKGTALGLAHTLFQTAVFRPAHRSKS